MEAQSSLAGPVMSVPASSERPGISGQGLVRAFEELFAAEYGRVVGIAARVLADRAEAEDVAQEVFLAFHRGHSPVAAYAPAWLHRAAWHAALNRLRGRRRRERRELTGAADRDDGWSADPGRIVERIEEQEQVRSAMRRLPARAAAVLALRYSGLSYAEVAAATGMGVGQVGTVLRRAEARLRREVGA
jgi:RNA polymerase sigma-70 factor (ECF subfamily)